MAFVLYDFCYYWLHRLGHERTLLWAFEAEAGAFHYHHQSEEHNLSTALRQTSPSSLSIVKWERLRLMAVLAVLIAAAPGGAGTLFTILGAVYLFANLLFIAQLADNSASSRLTEPAPLST